MAENPLLNLTTKRERRSIAVDGKTYELRNPDDLSILAEAQVQSTRNTCAKILETVNDGSASAEDGAKLSAALEILVATVVVNGAEFASKLSDAQKLAVVSSFLYRAGATPATAATLKKARQPKRRIKTSN
jgi:hypothetical protein